MAERNRRKPPAARVEAILARNAATGVIFRRGPSRFVRMLRWNLRNDRIEGGQWIEARVHVDRSDISPDGELVAAFVASYRRKPGTWTAISRPPFFTALAVWPKGDTWGGGGLFGSDTHFFLWHDTEVKYGIDQFKLMDDFTLPKRFRVQPFLDHRRCRRATSSNRAWCCPAGASCSATCGTTGYPRSPNPRSWRARSTIRSSRASSCGAGAPRSTILRAEVHDLTAGTQRDLGRVDWVDADRNGDVLWSAGGRLFRLAGPTRQGMAIDAEPKLVADLNDMTFEAIEAPKRALRWP